MILVTKILGALASPIVLAVFILCVSSLMSRTRSALQRRLSAIALVIIVFFSSPYIANALLASLERQFPPTSVSDTRQADVIVLLAGGIEVPQPPRLIAELGARGDRVLLAYRLWKAGKAPIILVSGGNVFTSANVKSESSYTKDILQEWGVPSEVIHIESESRNTRQSSKNIKDLFSTMSVNRVLLVTSAYHMPRTYQLMKNLAHTVIPATANHFIVNQTQPLALNLIPSTTSLDGSALALKEYLGMLFNYLTLAAPQSR